MDNIAKEIDTVKDAVLDMDEEDEVNTNHEDVLLRKPPDNTESVHNGSRTVVTELAEDQDLLYNVNDIPPIGIMISVAMQNILLGLGGALTTAYVISDVICASPDHPIRAKLFCTSLFMTGICTSLQTLIGIRLPIFQGVCSTFLIPLLAMKSEHAWKCENTFHSDSISTGNSTTSLNETSEIDSDVDLHFKLREIMGCLMLASLVEVIVGFTGLVGFLLTFIGPLTISVVISLIGLSLYKIPMAYIQTHWRIATLNIVLVIIFMLYMGHIGVPYPNVCGSVGAKAIRKPQRTPIFQMFPVLLSILITWVVSGILTAVGAFPDDPERLSYRARTDIRTGIIHRTPWFFVPYPGQFGSPLFNSTIFVGFVSAVISSILESIGDYYATAHISGVPPPPGHAVNRGILMEGLGSLLSGALGAAHATTSSTTHVALIGISKIASRACLVTAGILCILLSVVGKFGAVLSTMPDPIIGGAMFVTFGILGSIGIFTLRTVDLNSTRNMAIFGLSLYVGIVIPEWIERFPEAVDVGGSTTTGLLKGILGTPMFLGGLVAVILDNTVRGTLKERGFLSRDHQSDGFYAVSQEETYNFAVLNTLLKKYPCLQKLQFLPNIDDSDSNNEKTRTE